ncbi:hypothetical protein [Burkholderia ambifaria]|uniref:hypothetical protein n=1 Tax=Burkholderia ambifaria TaxID=152480 RepID=UPI0019D07ABF|nr:hypothetical protein [Burkholderia ambifaria]
MRQLLDEQPPQLLELHELELHELDDEQFELESEELDVEPDEPPPRAAMGGTGGGSISAIECAAHAVPASAPAPNNAVAHSTASGDDTREEVFYGHATFNATPPITLTDSRARAPYFLKELPLIFPWQRYPIE